MRFCLLGVDGVMMILLFVAHMWFRFLSTILAQSCFEIHYTTALTPPIARGV